MADLRPAASSRRDPILVETNRPAAAMVPVPKGRLHIQSLAARAMGLRRMMS